ncbi:MAG: DUF192 domain-containing protein [bacterium]
MRRLTLSFILFLLLATAASAAARFKQGTLTISQDAKRVVLQVEVADTPEARSQGLMSRPRLADNAGMLFIFEELGSWGFWMKNTLIPLSIAFIGDDWVIVDIKDMKVAPSPANGPFNIYESAKPFKYALEVNRGYFRTKGIGAGAKVRFELKNSNR